MKSIEWEIPDSVSTYHGKQGTNKIFGLDVDSRRNFSPAEAKARFMKTWNEKLRHAVDAATVIEATRAKERVPQKSAGFFRPNYEHREFKLGDCEFVVQIQSIADKLILDQLWFIPSADANPRALFVEFETVADKNGFDALAKRFGWEDGRELAKNLINDFIRNTEGPQ